MGHPDGLNRFLNLRHISLSYGVVRLNFTNLQLLDKGARTICDKSRWQYSLMLIYYSSLTSRIGVSILCAVTDWITIQMVGLVQYESSRQGITVIR